jgi:bacillithiol biosynthesis cysteine-adding enzyme BshC
MEITKLNLELHRINGFSGLLKAYLSSDPSLKALYGAEPSLQGFDGFLKQVSFEDLDRNLLADCLLRQYEESGVTAGPLTLSNIASLRKKSTYTVCTGHQLCLFTGPLYFIYKIISTVNLAEALHNAHPELDFVPVYWMATEDHDFEEINHVQLFGKKYSWEKSLAQGSTEASMPAGNINTSSLEVMLAEVEAVFGSSVHAPRLKELITSAYGSGRNMASATRSFTQSLLDVYGLVILDGNDTRLKAKFSPFIREELVSMPNYPLVQDGIEALAKAGFQSQVNPREINLFYMRDDLRARIEKTNGVDEYKVLGTDIHFSQAEILAELESHPERFSPNVVMRPLYQQVILPNVAYVGGPGELAYWLEFKKMFDRNKVVFPVLMPRNFVLWLDSASASRMDKLGMSIPELSGQLADIEKNYVSTRMNGEMRLEEEAEKLKELFSFIIAKVSQADPTLKAAGDAELQKALGGLKNLEAKLTRAEKMKHETALNQLRGLKEKLFPGGNLQERVDNFMPLYLKHGPSFLSTLKAQLNPFEKSLIVLSEKA